MSEELTVRTHDENPNLVVTLADQKDVAYCDFKPTTKTEQVSLFNAVNSSQHRLADEINETIKVMHVYAEMVQCTNKETGEVTVQPRTVLIDEKGEGHQCVSLGIFTSIRKIFLMVGEPASWEYPLPIKIKQVTKDKFKMLSLELDAKAIEEEEKKLQK